MCKGGLSSSPPWARRFPPRCCRVAFRTVGARPLSRNVPPRGLTKNQPENRARAGAKARGCGWRAKAGLLWGAALPAMPPQLLQHPPSSGTDGTGHTGGVPGVTPPCGSIPRSSLSAATAQARGSRMRNSSTRGGFGGGWRGNDAARELDLGTLLCTQHQAAGTAPKLAAWPGGKPTRRAGPGATVMGTATTNPFPRWARCSAPLRTPQKRDEGGGGWGHVRTPALPPHCSAPYLLPPHGSAGLAPAFGSSFPKYF